MFHAESRALQDRFGSRALADRLGLSVGDRFRLGVQDFTLTAILNRFPDDTDADEDTRIDEEPTAQD